MFEELAILTVMPDLPQKVEMRVIAEYSEKDGSVTMCLRYNGGMFDPMEAADSLRQTLIDNSARDLHYSFNPDDTLKNELTLTVL